MEISVKAQRTVQNPVFLFCTVCMVREFFFLPVRPSRRDGVCAVQTMS